jgi:DNA mismatch endonuclease (patch repair protein)
MSRVRGKDTKPEKLVRSFLHERGFRFRLHVSNLPGKPDIVLPKYRTVIFVNGCFWHHHPRCKRSAYPRQHKRFWREKINATVARDRGAVRSLRKLGWRVATVWECQIQRLDASRKKLEELIQNIACHHD